MTAIEITDVSKKFKSRSKLIWALKGVNLKVDEGDIFCLLGPNGAGKTTLIHIILTILIPDEGKVSIFGEDPFVKKETLQRINFVPVEKHYSHLRVKDFLACYARLYRTDPKKVKSLLKELKLAELEKSECWSLSTGERSRLALAKALLNDPKLLILDEPTFGLDPQMKGEIRTLLRRLNKRGMTIFFSTHDMLDAERLATKIAFIKEGKILDVQDKKKILKKFESVEKYWLRLGK